MRTSYKKKRRRAIRFSNSPVTMGKRLSKTNPSPQPAFGPQIRRTGRKPLYFRGFMAQFDGE
jgi:hypothetical protein